MSTTVLERATFRTSRLLDFASKKELVAQTGHQVEEWPYVIVKELIDNALDACEEAGIAPDILVTFDAAGIEVADNGPGLPEQVVKDVLDFAVRVSSRDAYVSPTRGAQGNALKTLVAMPFVLDGEHGKLEIEARGGRHTIVMGVDHVRQQPTIRHEATPGNNRGTRVRVHWNSASNEPDDKSRFLSFAGRFLWLNPHLSLTFDWFGDRIAISRTAEDWSKWKPSDPTSPHWYTPERLGRLVAAYISHDADKGRQKTVGEFVGEFRGLSGSAKRKAILNATGLFRAELSDLVKGNDLDHAAIQRLLMFMQSESKPVNPDILGVIGKDHFSARMRDLGCNMEFYSYRCAKGTTEGVPWVVEVAFGCSPDADHGRRIATGINWSPGIGNPFRNLNGVSLDAILHEQRAGRDEPIYLAIHLACARVEYTDRGKSAAVVLPEVADEIKTAVEAVTSKWAKQRKREERDASARLRRADAMRRSRRVSIKDAAYEVMEQAYLKASAGGTLPAHARQIMYAARGAIQEIAGRLLDDVYFTQTLLPDYIQEHGVDWNVVYDARGHFTEPHTGKTIALGTLQVRGHLADIHRHQVGDPHYDIIDKNHPTLGPKNRYGAILFIEKEGFLPLFNAVHLAERYDLAIMSTKGMSVTASRELVDELCGLHEIPLLVLHDFDVAGFSIFGTLSADTRRYQFNHNVDVTDLGLRLADIDGLESEDAPPIKSQQKVVATLLRHGATVEECKFLMNRRVELNALPSDQLVAFIERKLAEHGVAKVSPDADTLADAYRRMHRQAQVQQRIDDLLEEMESEPEDAITIPTNLQRKIKAAQKKDPSIPWDVALREIVALGCGI